MVETCCYGDIIESAARLVRAELLYLNYTAVVDLCSTVLNISPVLLNSLQEFARNL
jgi:hypothetical protein